MNENIDRRSDNGKTNSTYQKLNESNQNLLFRPPEEGMTKGVGNSVGIVIQGLAVSLRDLKTDLAFKRVVPYAEQFVRVDSEGGEFIEAVARGEFGKLNPELPAKAKAINRQLEKELENDRKKRESCIEEFKTLPPSISPTPWMLIIGSVFTASLIAEGVWLLGEGSMIISMVESSYAYPGMENWSLLKKIPFAFVFLGIGVALHVGYYAASKPVRKVMVTLALIALVLIAVAVSIGMPIMYSPFENAIETSQASAEMAFAGGDEAEVVTEPETRSTWSMSLGLLGHLVASVVFSSFHTGLYTFYKKKAPGMKASVLEEEIELLDQRIAHNESNLVEVQSVINEFDAQVEAFVAKVMLRIENDKVAYFQGARSPLASPDASLQVSALSVETPSAVS